MLSQTKARCFVIAVGLAFIVGGQTARAARKLHVVIAADENDASIGKYCQTDRTNIESLFLSNVDPASLRTHVVPASSLTQTGLPQFIQGLSVGPEDAVVFYYSGHGNYARDGQHYLVVAGQWISRSAVTSTLQSLSAGLTVMMTDACFNFHDVVPPQRAIGVRRQIPVTSPLFRKLFFEANGFIDLNSCQRDEKAATHAEYGLGSVFTKALNDTMKAKSSMGDATWQSIINDIAAETATQFALLHPDGETIETGDGNFLNQRSQTVARLALNVVPHNPGPAPGPTPGIPPLPSESNERQVTIDARSGQTTEQVITYKYFPDTGRTQTLLGPLKSLGKASLVRATDNTPYWRWPRVQTPDRISGELTYVQAILPDRGPGSEDKPKPPPGTRTLAVKRLGILAANGAGGVQIRNVDAGGPATKCQDTGGRIWRLEAGDRISILNGMAVTDANQLRRAIRTSPALASITVIGVDGARHALTTKLNPVGSGTTPTPIPPPDAKPGKGPRFGVVVAAATGMGVVITRVVPGSPATRCYLDGQKYRLEAGDQITHVNGRKITSEASFANAIRSSPKKMRIRVSDPSKGTSYSFTTTLNN